MHVFGGCAVLADWLKTKEEDWILRADYDERGKEGKFLTLTFDVMVYL
jgi:actin-related protein